MKRILCVALGILLVGSLLAAATSTWGMLYHTGLETPDYEADQPLVGQDGWTNLISPDAAAVVAGRKTAAGGRRAVECWGGGPLVSIGELPDRFLLGAWEQVITFDAVTDPAIVRVECDIRLDGPDTGNGPGADFVSANFYGRNGSHRAPFFYISSNGNAYANAFTETGEVFYAFETPIKIGAYNHYAMIMNYATHMATFEVNRKAIGALPFGGTGEAFHSVALEFASYDNLEVVDPKLYTGYWDNISVRAKPAK